MSIFRPVFQVYCIVFEEFGHTNCIQHTKSMIISSVTFKLAMRTIFTPTELILI